MLRTTIQSLGHVLIFWYNLSNGKEQNGSSKSGMGGMDWIDMAQDRGRWRAVVNAVMNLRIPQNAGNFLTS
jgi:hypothetical protein